MKFLVAPTPQSLGRAKPPVRLFLGFAGLLLACLVAQRAALGQLTPAGVLEHYLPGDEPTPLAALVEDLHTGAFLGGFLFLMLGSLLAVTPVSARTRAWLTFAPAVAWVFDLATPFAVALWGAPPALRVSSFALAVGLSATSVAVLLVRFGRPGAPASGR